MVLLVCYLIFVVLNLVLLVCLVGVDCFCDLFCCVVCLLFGIVWFCGLKVDWFGLDVCLCLCSWSFVAYWLTF